MFNVHTLTPNDHKSFIRRPSTFWRIAALDVVHNRIQIIAVTVDAVRVGYGCFNDLCFNV